jgi:hypothetical protein
MSTNIPVSVNPRKLKPTKINETTKYIKQNIRYVHTALDSAYKCSLVL